MKHSAVSIEINPITLEVIRNRLDAIVREMAEVTMRTARSAVVYNGRDFSCALFNHRAELLSIGTSVPIHIFPTVAQVEAVFQRYRKEISPGDIFIANDPFEGGTHLMMCWYSYLFS
jgi:N-methylhydantoinase B